MVLDCDFSHNCGKKMPYAALLLNEVLEVSPADSTLNIQMLVAPNKLLQL